MRPTHVIFIFILLLRPELGIAQQGVLPPSVSGSGSVKALVVEQTCLLNWTIADLQIPIYQGKTPSFRVGF
jgi:hypothetical protein